YNVLKDQYDFTDSQFAKMEVGVFALITNPEQHYVNRTEALLSADNKFTPRHLTIIDSTIARILYSNNPHHIHRIDELKTQYQCTASDFANMSVSVARLAFNQELSVHFNALIEELHFKVSDLAKLPVRNAALLYMPPMIQPIRELITNYQFTPKNFIVINSEVCMILLNCVRNNRSRRLSELVERFNLTPDYLVNMSSLTLQRLLSIEDNSPLLTSLTDPPLLLKAEHLVSMSDNMIDNFMLLNPEQQNRAAEVMQRLDLHNQPSGLANIDSYTFSIMIDPANIANVDEFFVELRRIVDEYQENLNSNFRELAHGQAQQVSLKTCNVIKNIPTSIIVTACQQGLMASFEAVVKHACHIDIQPQPTKSILEFLDVQEINTVTTLNQDPMALHNRITGRDQINR
ncbi:MAG: hypothetical protein AAF153_02990, partial [Pseudomonadota bacterium]